MFRLTSRTLSAYSTGSLGLPSSPSLLQSVDICADSVSAVVVDAALPACGIGILRDSGANMVLES